MGAAFVALGQTLVDAIAVGLIGNNEDATVGRSGRCGEQQGAGQQRAGQELAGNECGGKSHGGTENGKRDRPSQLDPKR